MGPLRERRRRCLGPRALVARGDRRWPHVFHITSAYGHDQRYPRHQQQQQDGFAERRSSNFPYRPKPHQMPAISTGRASAYNLSVWTVNAWATANETRAHRKGCEHHRLKDCALRVLGTPAQLRPPSRNTPQPGQSADQAVCDAHCTL